MAASATVGYQNRTDIVFDMNTATAAATETFRHVTTRAFVVTGVTVICKATAVNGAVNVLKGAGVITTGGVPCDTLNVVAQGGVIDQANAVFAIGDVLNVRISALAAGSFGTIVVQTEPLSLGDATVIIGT